MRNKPHRVYIETDAQRIRRLHAQAAASEAKRVAAHATDAGYERLKAARAKRARRNAKRLESLAL